MQARPTLTPLHDALIELDRAGGRSLLLAEAEVTPLGEPLRRLRRALSAVQESRDLADELVAATGRAVVHLLDGASSAHVQVA